MNSGEVVILGGGVIGLTTAYFLAREGVGVRLLDRGAIGREASWAGAGILPPSDWSAAYKPIDRLRALSGRLFPDLSAELREQTGIDNGFVRCGGIQFIGQQCQSVTDEWTGEGVPTEPLDEDAGRRLEPALAARLGEVRVLPTLAQLRNPWHLRALHQAALGTGRVHIDPDREALDFVRDGRRVRAVRTARGAIAGDMFVVAAGAWADQVLEPLVGARLMIAPVRGQIALLNPGRLLFRHVLIWGSRYLVPRQDGRVLAGSTEENAGFVKQTTATGICGLLRLAMMLVSELANAEVEQTWSGLRPGSPDGLPFIGPVPGLDNVLVAAGHFRAGIQLSPGTALLLKELILGQPLTMPLEAFRPERVIRDK